MRVGRLVEERLIKRRREVWIALRAETELFIRSGRFSYLYCERISQNMKRVHVIRIGAELCCHFKLSLYQKKGIKALDLIVLRDRL